MSNHFDLFCRTCDVKANVFHSNWGDSTIARIALDLAVLKDLHTVFGRLTSELRFGHRAHSESCMEITEDLLEFATAHAGHDVAARSEYGNFHDRCETFYACPCCQHNQACQREPAHEGDHGPREASP